MTSCKNLKRIKTRHCIGAFNKLIDVIKDDLRGVTGSDPLKNKTILDTVKAKVVTIAPVDTFDGTNVNQIQTHTFTTKFKTSITPAGKNDSIGYNGKFFRIERVENRDEENEELIFFCTARGIDTQEGNRG